MGAQLIHAAYQAGVKKLSVLAPSAPIQSSQECHLKRMTSGMAIRGNQCPYGLPKPSWFNSSLRQQYGFNGIYLLPVNLYGPETTLIPIAPVIPALICKVHCPAQGRKGNGVWGDGSPTREFLYSEDAARGIVMATVPRL